MDYIFSSRNVRNGAFGSEPGPTKFLGVAATMTGLNPSQAIARTAWIKAVIEQAKSGTNPNTGQPVGDILI